MNLKPLSASLKVSGQLLPKDIEALKEQGFASVICNRPDHAQDEADQDARQAAQNQLQQR